MSCAACCRFAMAIRVAAVRAMSRGVVIRAGGCRSAVRGHGPRSIVYPFSSSSLRTAAGRVNPAGAQVGKSDAWSPARRSRSSILSCWLSASVNRPPVADHLRLRCALRGSAGARSSARVECVEGVSRRDEVLEPAAWHGLSGGVAVVDGQYGVALPPDDQCRHVLGEVEAIACVHELPARSARRQRPVGWAVPVRSFPRD